MLRYSHTVWLSARTATRSAQAAPQTPFYYYHIPSKTGVSFPYTVSDLVGAADANIPTFRGVKFTDYQLDDFQIALQHEFTQGASWRVGQKVDMLFGRDEYLLAAVTYGCAGAVGSTYNFNGEMQQKVFSADKNTAARAQLATARFIQAVSSVDVGGAYVWKMVADAIGISMGPARLPYLPPDAKAIETLAKSLTVWCQTTDKDLRPSWCRAM